MKKRIFNSTIILLMITLFICVFQNIANASGIVTYQGDYINTVTVYGTSTTLPTAPDGYYYKFFVNNKQWDGNNITEDITVTVIKFAYPIHTVTYQGDYSGTEAVREDKQAVMDLPTPDDGYYYTFTSQNKIWEGKNIKSDVTVDVALKKFPFSAGDYITFGKDGTEKIKWRCVSFEKITGYNENSQPIVDPTDTRTTYREGYLPLLTTDHVLFEQRQFSTGGRCYNDGPSYIVVTQWGNNGRFDFPIEEEIHYIWNETGSSNWESSLLRDWLNNSGGYGFLDGFSESERSLIKTVQRKTVIDNGYNRPASGRTSLEWYAKTYCDGFKWQTTIDSVFLLDVKQIYDIKNRSDLLG